MSTAWLIYKGEHENREGEQTLFEMNVVRRHRDAEGNRLPPNDGFESIPYDDRRRPSSAPGRAGRNPPGRRG